jgi:hypothetical protein
MCLSNGVSTSSRLARLFAKRHANQVLLRQFVHQVADRAVGAVAQEALDAAVIDAVAKALDGETVRAAVKGAVALLTAQHADVDGRRASICAELAAIAARERKLLDAIADGDGAVAEAIRGRLREELTRRDRLTADLAGLEGVPAVDVDKLLADVEQRARDLRGVLSRRPQAARQALRLILGGGRWTGTPFDDASGRGYHFHAERDYRRLGIKALSAFTIGESASWAWRRRRLRPAVGVSPAEPWPRKGEGRHGSPFVE